MRSDVVIRRLFALVAAGVGVVAAYAMVLCAVLEYQFARGTMQMAPVTALTLPAMFVGLMLLGPLGFYVGDQDWDTTAKFLVPATCASMLMVGSQVGIRIGTHLGAALIPAVAVAAAMLALNNLHTGLLAGRIQTPEAK